MRYILLFIFIWISKNTTATSLDNNFWIYTQVKTHTDAYKIISFSQFKYLSEKIVKNEIVFIYQVSTYFDHLKPQPDETDTAYIIQNKSHFNWTAANSSKVYDFKIDIIEQKDELNTIDKLFSLDEMVGGLKKALGQSIAIFNNSAGQELQLFSIEKPFALIKSNDTFYKQLNHLNGLHFENAWNNKRSINGKPHFVEGDSFVINQYGLDNSLEFNLLKQYFYSSKFVGPGAYQINQYSLNYNDWQKNIVKDQSIHLSLKDNGYYLGNKFIKDTVLYARIYIDSLGKENNALFVSYPIPFLVHPTRKDTVWVANSFAVANNQTTFYKVLTTYPFNISVQVPTILNLQQAYTKVNDVYVPYKTLMPLDTFDTKKIGVQDMYLKKGKLFMDVYYEYATKVIVTIQHKNKVVYEKDFGLLDAKQINQIQLDYKVLQGKAYAFSIETRSNINGMQNSQVESRTISEFKHL